ncbi:hypothetical protein CKM354_001279100 [Cercospora kikuchii]|uniref:Uncharacterized protein n=1 Tax=Cercospora kikuchii TaxID=84275 RepID=A0A9P3L1Q7_9PEZI|nr:uncharacterized protein CKM354_001279100 [Cercospora kikuchii]GIZ49764.1 hypothetical protein CKM354_001279100 [Cercospora kikuchii]
MLLRSVLLALFGFFASTQAAAIPGLNSTSLVPSSSILPRSKSPHSTYVNYSEQSCKAKTYGPFGASYDIIIGVSYDEYSCANLEQPVRSIGNVFGYKCDGTDSGQMHVSFNRNVFDGKPLNRVLAEAFPPPFINGFNCPDY